MEMKKRVLIICLAILTCYFGIPDSGAKAIELSVTELKNYEGDFSSTAVPLGITLKVDGDQFFFQSAGVPATPLTPFSASEFRGEVAGIPIVITFKTDDSGAIQYDAFTMTQEFPFKKKDKVSTEIDGVDVGTGPYPSVMVEDSGLPVEHKIFRPGDLSPFGKKNPLPVVICSGVANQGILSEIASHGFLVISIGFAAAPGAVPAGVQDGSAGFLDDLDWATAENDRPGSPYYQKIDTTRVAVAGVSASALHAMKVSMEDPRVTTTIVWSMGTLVETTPEILDIVKVDIKKEDLQKLHVPILYIVGSEDHTREMAEDDFKRITTVPVFLAINIGMGHGCPDEPNGGGYGIVSSAWLKWQLGNDKEATGMFIGKDCGLCRDTESWIVRGKNLE